MSTPPYTRERDRVFRIADARPDEALKTARRIDKAWYRCQSLARIAYARQKVSEKNRLLEEAFAAALDLEEPNRIVTVSAWPLRVLCESGQGDRARAETERLLAIIAEEPSPVRRADALNTLLGAVFRGPRDLFWYAFDQFERTCRTPLASGKRNVKGESHLAHWYLVVVRWDAARAENLSHGLRGPVLRERAVGSVQRYADVTSERWISWPNLR